MKIFGKLRNKAVAVVKNTILISAASSICIFQDPACLFSTVLIFVMMLPMNLNFSLLTPMAKDTIILDVRNLVTSFHAEDGRVKAVDDVNFSVVKGKTLGIVGESGCGKSVTSLSIMRLLPKPAGQIDRGTILFNGENLLDFTPEEMYRIRGNKISMIFQEPMTALNPVYRVGKQLGEVYKLHFPKMTQSTIIKDSIDILAKVGIPDPDKRINEYPHQLSGGMRQRVMIAMALACNPDILIADEPTTALDVTIQAQILDLMRSLQQTTGMTIIFITHDLGVTAQMCDDVLVMYAGKVVETAPVVELFKNPKHPYTHGLLRSIPRLDSPRKVKLSTIEGFVPSLTEMPSGCRFQNRCSYAQPICKSEVPNSETIGESHTVNCFEWRNICE